MVVDMQRQTASIQCPKSLIGRVIGKNGETVKALQVFTSTSIQVDQTCDPCLIILSGTPQSLHLATSMITDIIRGTFRGFSLMRQLLHKGTKGDAQAAMVTQMVYAPGFGLIPASEFGAQDPGLRGTAIAVPLGASSAFPAGVQPVPGAGPAVMAGVAGGQPYQATPTGSILPGLGATGLQPLQQPQAHAVPGVQQVSPRMMGTLQPQAATPLPTNYSLLPAQSLQQQQQLQQQHLAMGMSNEQYMLPVSAVGAGGLAAAGGQFQAAGAEGMYGGQQVGNVYTAPGPPQAAYRLQQLQTQLPAQVPAMSLQQQQQQQHLMLAASQYASSAGGGGPPLEPSGMGGMGATVPDVNVGQGPMMAPAMPVYYYASMPM